MNVFPDRRNSLLAFLVILSGLLVMPVGAIAQFEGDIHFKAVEMEQSPSQERMYLFSAAPDRIYLESDRTHRFYGGLDVTRFLVREDRNDITFMNEDQEALQITKEETETLGRMIRQVRGNQNTTFDWENQVEVTGRSRDVQGYRAEEIRVVSEDGNSSVSVWLTDQIKISWGLIEDVWNESLSVMIQAELPIELFMNRNSFPLYIEYFENDVRTTIVEAVEIDRSDVDRSRLEVPSGMTMLRPADVMMRMMRGRR